MSEAVHHGNGIYWKTWGWLLVLTCLALGVGLIEGIPAGLKTTLLVGLTLVKVVVIGAFFMHLRSEKLNLVLITFCPMVLALIMFFFMFPDAGDSATRVLSLR